MSFIFMYFIFIILISSILLLLNKFISIYKKKDYEKSSPFECGFNPITKANLPFSLPFFLMTMMFLIFDVEIILFLPIIFYLKSSSTMISYLMISIFLILLIATLILEWMNNYLNWLF
uniref:NADH-ubiquinone oxidoreductase chain 3 n=16 Tax=Apis mellifera TaxID=7460 RepID=A0A291LR96_APIME|nr:NADH dehydrogenase subunit 3 [Apis mellifera sahariensis]YP_009971675.1 NADH dehydrogenase subunit 3 [Apis mellifera]AHY80998.1 NADH dehydrogenase subunit 3 [Apis mellifera mellifera]AIA77371.1 NADH dehydrogenase subunit 3 [Apis mellifera scutellata]AIS38999.1 NADH dehydrogenase subunit 3 [Apis mellifera intermissa]AJF44097.1 NADH dehydrogenase subunit 3 [Apis mellifera syriaca]APU52715.1 NADH dehydrogenase subunit 3 [Apis mellifera capensis]APU89623.1 NADH dehydrogenase subunit 3 [Apis m